MKSREHATVASLPHGDQRKLEVALLMALEPKVFMFDEPTAGMNAAEAPVILDLIRQLKQDRTKTILLVEQFLDFCREIADDIYVMDRGEIQHAGPASDLDLPEVRRHLMV